jgi:hypothetical protein
MADIDPWTGARLGDMNDAMLGGLYLAQVVTDLRLATCPQFATVAARDTAVVALAAAGVPVRNGMSCWTDDAGFWDRIGGAWKLRVVSTTGALTPATGWGAGYGNYSIPGYHLSGDGLVTLRGMVQRTGANVVLNGTSGPPVTFLNLPTAIQPPHDIAPGGAYFGSAASVQTVDARLVCAAGSGALQVTPMDAGTYTVYTTNGFVNVDGVSWWL